MNSNLEGAERVESHPYDSVGFAALLRDELGLAADALTDPDEYMPLDSVQLMHALLVIEELCDVEIPASDVDPIATYADLFHLYSQLVSGASSSEYA